MIRTLIIPQTYFNPLPLGWGMGLLCLKVGVGWALEGRDWVYLEGGSWECPGMGRWVSLVGRGGWVWVGKQCRDSGLRIPGLGRKETLHWVGEILLRTPQACGWSSSAMWGLIGRRLRLCSLSLNSFSACILLPPSLSTSLSILFPGF